MRRENKKIIPGRVVFRKKRELALEEESLDSERDRVRKSAKRKKFLSVFVLVCLVLGVIAMGWFFIKGLIEIAERGEVGVGDKKEKFSSTLVIYDENGTGGVSERTKEYVWQLESDLKDLGYEITRASLPVGKMREVDVEIKEIDVYFRVNIDRESAVTAEDIVRMIKYLEVNNITNISYVDVRVEGKAYYK